MLDVAYESNVSDWNYEAEHWICLSEMRNYAAFLGEYQGQVDWAIV